MEKTDRQTWQNEMVKIIGEYTGKNPVYSPRDLAVVLAEKFYIDPADALKLASLAINETAAGCGAGLAAVELNLTFNCNLTCAYCFIHDKGAHERMSFATAKNAVDLLMERAAYPFVNITFIGGEPLLEFNLIKQVTPYAMEAAARRNISVTWAITSNGSLVNEEIMKFFAQNRINMLLSLDGGRKNHDRYRRTKSGKGTWDKIVDLIPLIKSYQPWLGVRMTVSTEAIDDMEEDFKTIADLGANQFIIAPAQGAQCWSKEQIERYGLNLVKILRDYHELKRGGFPIFIEEFEKDENDFAGWGCRAGSTSLAVAPNGDVSPCSKMLGLTDEKGKYIVGNVNTGINYSLLKPFLDPLGHVPSFCKQCTRPCSGGCYAVNFEQTGDHFTASEENCLFWAVCQETKRLSKMMNMCGTKCHGCNPNQA